MIGFQFNDGGRAAAGYQGRAGDCVTRAIAIASGLPYDKVYQDLFALSVEHRDNGRGQLAKAYRSGKQDLSPRTGVNKRIYRPYIDSLGFEWTPTMGIGTGCQVHLRADELPSGQLIVRVTRHLCAVIDGVIHDTHDCSRSGTRCVYGYWQQPVLEGS